MLDFHTREATDVNVAAEVLASSKSLLGSHVQIESLVGLVLAISDTSLLLSGLCELELVFEAVLVALSEQELSKRCCFERLLFVTGVLGPI